MKELVEKAEKAASLFPVIDYVSVCVVGPFHIGNARRDRALGVSA